LGCLISSFAGGDFQSMISETVKYAPAWTPCFEVNTGRYDSTIRYFSLGPDYRLALEAERAVFALAPPGRASNAVPVIVQMGFVESHPYPQIVAEEPLPRRIRYFTGATKPELVESTAYSKIHYKSIYPGIDLFFICGKGTLEYYFVLSGQANLNDVVLELRGIERLALGDQGELIVRTPAGAIIRPAPRFFQEIGGRRVEVVGSYVLLSGNRVGFNAEKIEELAALIVDPVLLYLAPPQNWSPKNETPPSMDDVIR
ncbi:MAG: hypothetical protein V2A34_04860, partial [Lentisphaerota bacterium]